MRDVVAAYDASAIKAHTRTLAAELHGLFAKHTKPHFVPSPLPVRNNKRERPDAPDSFRVKGTRPLFGRLEEHVRVFRRRKRR